jgi:hypothetical protein
LQLSVYATINSFLFAPLAESFLHSLPQEEQAEYHKKLPNFTMMIKDHVDHSSTKED